MANPQPDKYTKISNELFEAILQTDFSKRQQNILFFIFRLSYGCGKKHAALKPSDFELCGVRKTHIKSELNYLKDSNVLHISNDIYSLNKDYDTWRISLIKTADKDKFKEVLNRNIALKEVTETVINESINDVNELLKQELPSYQNSNSEVTKTVTDTPSNPLHDAELQASKESIKESIKEISSSSDHLDAQKNIYQLFESEGFGTISSIIKDQLEDFINTYGERWTREAMKIAVLSGTRTLKYVNGILKRFKSKGIDKPWEEEQRKYGKTHQPSDQGRASPKDPALETVTSSQTVGWKRTAANAKHLDQLHNVQG